MTKCDTPGVMRVYYGPNGTINANRCNRYGGGRYCGHFEFKGTDDRWHAACVSSIPANEKEGRARRVLKACYVPK